MSSVGGVAMNRILCIPLWANLNSGYKFHDVHVKWSIHKWHTRGPTLMSQMKQDIARLAHEWMPVPSSTSHSMAITRNPLFQTLESFACMLSPFSHIQLFGTPQTVAHQAPLSMGFSRQEYWSGLPCPSPGDLPDPGIKPISPAEQADSLPTEPSGRHPSVPYTLRELAEAWEDGHCANIV